MYEAMVKEAYENILGFEKEAGVKDVAATAWGGAKKAGKGYVDALTAKGVRNTYAKREKALNDLSGMDPEALKQYLKSHNLSMGSYIKPGLKTVGAVGGTAAALGLAAYGGRKLHDKKKARKAQQALEAAESQKEAAENDYLEACAYEEAALEVLAELGYDVDAFVKEASEDYDDGMTAEEMDEAAFNYLAERGYFDKD
jgi:gas vesicle protein